MAQTMSQSFGGKSNSQKYMLMSSQEEVLRRRLSLHIPSAAPMTASSPEMQSLSTSPTYSRPFYSSTWTPSLGYTSTSPIPIHPGTIYEHHGAQDEDSNNMGDVNQRIKATLTELLNTESVRSDEKYRAWIQERLMDAERKIRQQRRRRSSTVNGEELATSIASHIDYHVAPCKSWT